jgi:hypothetical protein
LKRLLVGRRLDTAEQAGVQVLGNEPCPDTLFRPPFSVRRNLSARNSATARGPRRPSGSSVCTKASNCWPP